tara:strand:+ start:107 stop:448 length:342 start_codon:yes stop_codon:yes gene_type:complete
MLKLFQKFFRSNKLLIILTTESNYKNAKHLADSILKLNLAACISLHEINSNYWWNGDLIETKEIQLFIKTSKNSLGPILKAVRKSHSYQNPEIIHWEASGSSKYVNWLNSVVN